MKTSPEYESNKIKQLQRALEIEAALEKIRAQANAIQHSDEFQKVAEELLRQLMGLGIADLGVGIIIGNHEAGIAQIYSANRDCHGKEILTGQYEIPLDGIDLVRKVVNEENKSSFSIALEGAALKEWFEFEKQLAPREGQLAEGLEDSGFEKVYHHFARFYKAAVISIATLEELPPENQIILNRMAETFGQCYTRFLDLQKAEEQAREAQIQAALERIRTAAMAMQSSEDLMNVATVMREHMGNLGQTELESSIVHTYDEGFETFTARWVFRPLEIADAEVISGIAYIKVAESAWAREVIRNYRSAATDYTIESRGAMLKEWYEVLSRMAPKTVDYDEKGQIIVPEVLFYHFSKFSGGALLTITGEPPAAEAKELQKRAAGVFDLAYRRFLDLKKAEAQAREAQIEAALERVRAASMAMHKSEELAEVVAVVFDQFKQLELAADSSAIFINSSDGEAGEAWIVGLDELLTKPSKIRITFSNDATLTPLFKHWKSGTGFRNYSFKGKALEAFMQALYKHSKNEAFKEYKHLSYIENWEGYHKYGGVLLSAHEALPEETGQIVYRFAQVFEQSYTRFLDLAKAEAQAREAQIEAALERVRSASMAMHKSEELHQVALALLTQIKQLGIPCLAAAIIIVGEEKENFLSYTAYPTARDDQLKLKIRKEVPVKEFWLSDKSFRLFKEGVSEHTIKAGPAEIELLIEHTRKYESKKRAEKLRKAGLELMYFHSVKFEGMSNIVLSSLETLSEADWSIMRRMANTFGMSYRRFLDLQKAETQAREAQIEVALERIRARAMAMHRSEELPEIALVLWQQLNELQLNDLNGCAIHVLDDASGTFEAWGAFPETIHGEQQMVLVRHRAKQNSTSVLREFFKRYRAGESEIIIEMNPEQIAEFIDYFAPALPDLADDFKAMKLKKLYGNFICFSNGWIGAHSFEPLQSETRSVLRRMTGVFDLAYRRFEDLKKAEEQAREAQIEVALERVRARALAMHDSNELAEVALVMRGQMALLGQAQLEVVTIHLYPEEGDEFESWFAFRSPQRKEGKIITDTVKFSKTDTAIAREMLSLFHSPQTVYHMEVQGEDLDEWQQMIMERKPLFKENWGDHIPIYQYWYFADFSGGSFLLIPREEPNEEAKELLRRSASVFDLAYRRYLDLRQAEAQAREAQIEAALERVRARTMAMHKSDELRSVIAVVFEQLQELGFEAAGSCFVIYENERGDATIWLSGFGSEIYPESYKAPYFDHPYLNAQLEAWKEGIPFRSFVWEGELKKSVDEYYFQHTDYKKFSPEIKEEIVNFGRTVLSNAFMTHGFLEIAGKEPISEDQEAILRRFAKVFDQAYTRFLDLEKAEAQAREAQIEAALEKVRARAMAMHSSEELKEVVSELRKQMGLLGQPDLEVCVLHLYEKDADYFESWGAIRPPGKDQKLFQFMAKFPKKGLMIIDEMMAHYHKGSKDYVLVNEGEKAVEFFNMLKTSAPEIHNRVMHFVGNTPIKEVKAYWSMADFSGGALGMVTYSYPDEEARDLLRRSANVFELAYTRYLDLEKAEAQAREAQIEAALERIRARTNGMHHSDELSELVDMVFKELTKLQLAPIRYTIWVIDADTQSMRLWLASAEGDSSAKGYLVPYHEHPVYLLMLEAWRRRDKNWSYTLKGEEKRSWDQYLFSETEMSTMPEEVIAAVMNTPKSNWYATFYDYGGLQLFVIESLPDDQLDVFKRFSRVFDQSYTRFLDLQKAEARAYEAKIEAALERVRAATMAMHRSEELSEVIQVLYKEIAPLGLARWACRLHIYDKANEIMQVWAQQKTTTNHTRPFNWPGRQHPIIEEFWSAWENRFPYYIIHLKDQEKVDFDNYVLEHTEYKDLPEKTKAFMRNEREVFFTIANVNFGQMVAADFTPLSDSKIVILQRFAKVFDQAFIRFLDIQKAEARAREAEIESSLERIRSRAMAMHKSEELNEVVAVVLNELTNLGFEQNLCSIGIYHDESKGCDWWISAPGEDVLPRSYHMPYLDGEWFREIYEAWKRQDRYYVFEMTGEIKKRHDVLSMEHTEMKYLPEATKEMLRSIDSFKASYVSMAHGMLEVVTEDPLSDQQIEILQRFTKVIDLTYTRVDDLQQAEARAREATITASLDRVRAEIASMRRLEDLQRITPLLWEELTKLGVPFFRCGVFIMDEAEERARIFLSTPAGEAVASLHLDFDSADIVRSSAENWRKQQPYVERWDKKQFLDWAQSLEDQGLIDTTETYQAGRDAPELLYLQLLPFKQGMLYIGSQAELSTAQLELAQALAQTFEVAYARYEDFVQLEQAKKRVEIALSDLKSAQNQLVQSEKMASLGELTAGIAHEIQNPLNFVNNFSEVSSELLEEMKEELLQGNTEELLDLLSDLNQNLAKIHHHGERASAIVKGMLQHSRTSSNQKELTDINALCDEYLRLAYHACLAGGQGMRAKDRSFNCKFETDFDAAIPKLNVVPQDIGRVLLNLINNAFYVVDRKAQDDRADYQPKVRVSTKMIVEQDLVQIIVSDNGSGIPKENIDKIFQPFFTTKPTGQGTGLGLSLAYDIVKAHEGELKVDSKVGEGTAFMMCLPNR